MASTRISARRSITSTVIIVVVLALLLAALGGAYYLLTRPAQLKSTDTQKNRNFLFSIYGFEGDLLRRPTGVGFDNQGNIHVADTGKRRIVEFDSRGNFVTTYGEPGKGPLQLWAPIDVAVADDGRAYVIDKSQKKMVIYDSTHKPIQSITFKEDNPLSVTVANNALFVTTDSGVIIGTLDGKFQTGYVKRGKQKGEFDRPGGVTVDKDGTLYVADTLNYRIQALGTNGRVKWVYGSPLPADQAVNYNGKDRKFGLPSNLTLDENGYIFVVDGLSSEIVVLDKDGKFIEKIGDIGHDDGTFYYPDGIDYRNGRIAIADKFNDRIEVFSDPHAPAIADTLSKGLPYGLLLLVIPLLALLLLLRRKSSYVIAPSFADILAADTENGPEVAQALKRVNAAAALAAAHEGDVEKLKWDKRKIDEKEVTDLMTRFGLDRDQAEALDIAAGMSGKGVLLAEDEALKVAAPQVDVSVVTYAELLEALRGGNDEPDTGGETDADADVEADAEPVAEAPVEAPAEEASSEDKGDA